MPYMVMVDDSFHYMDPSARYQSGEFANADAAIAHCKEIVDEYLQAARTPGMAAAQLWDSYVAFGEDPFRQGVNEAPVRFSAWDYARARCPVLCTDGRPAGCMSAACT